MLSLNNTLCLIFTILILMSIKSKIFCNKGRYYWSNCETIKGSVRFRN